MDPKLVKLILLTAFPYAPAQNVLSETRRRFPTLRLAAPTMPDLSRCDVLAVEAPPEVEPAILTGLWSDPDFLSDWLRRPARLGGVVALLDARRVPFDLRSRDRLLDRGWARTPQDGRSVADLLVEQIEAASILALLDPDDQIETTRRQVRALNPTARIALCGAADVGLPRRLLTAEEPAYRETTPPWLRALRGEPPWPADFRGGRCLVYHRRLPFDPERLGRWLETPFPGLLRGKGHLWLRDRWDERIGYSCAGSFQRTFPAGRWWASAAPGQWPACSNHAADLLAAWHPVLGDREQRLVLLGDELELDPARITESLDACLSDSAADGRLAAASEPPGGRDRRLH